MASSAAARRQVKAAQVRFAVGTASITAHYFLDAVTAYRTAVSDLG